MDSESHRARPGNPFSIPRKAESALSVDFAVGKKNYAPPGKNILGVFCWERTQAMPACASLRTQRAKVSLALALGSTFIFKPRPPGCGGAPADFPSESSDSTGTSRARSSAWRLPAQGPGASCRPVSLLPTTMRTGWACRQDHHAWTQGEVDEKEMHQDPRRSRSNVGVEGLLTPNSPLIRVNADRRLRIPTFTVGGTMTGPHLCAEASNALRTPQVRTKVNAFGVATT